MTDTLDKKARVRLFQETKAMLVALKKQTSETICSAITLLEANQKTKRGFDYVHKLIVENDGPVTDLDLQSFHGQLATQCTAHAVKIRSSQTNSSGKEPDGKDLDGSSKTRTTPTRLAVVELLATVQELRELCVDQEQDHLLTQIPGTQEILNQWSAADVGDWQARVAAEIARLKRRKARVNPTQNKTEPAVPNEDPAKRAHALALLKVARTKVLADSPLQAIITDDELAKLDTDGLTALTKAINEEVKAVSQAKPPTTAPPPAQPPAPQPADPVTKATAQLYAARRQALEGLTLSKPSPLLAQLPTTLQGCTEAQVQAWIQELQTAINATGTKATEPTQTDTSGVEQFMWSLVAIAVVLILGVITYIGVTSLAKIVDNTNDSPVESTTSDSTPTNSGNKLLQRLDKIGR